MFFFCRGGFYSVSVLFRGGVVNHWNWKEVSLRLFRFSIFFSVFCSFCFTVIVRIVAGSFFFFGGGGGGGEGVAFFCFDRKCSVVVVEIRTNHLFSTW